MKKISRKPTNGLIDVHSKGVMTNIKSLSKEYDYLISENQYAVIYYSLNELLVWDQMKYEAIEEYSEALKLIQLIKLCEDNTLVVTANISKPQKGFIKGESIKVEINNTFLLHSINSALNTIINQYDKKTKYLKIPEKEEHSYTIDEISTMLKDDDSAETLKHLDSEAISIGHKALLIINSVLSEVSKKERGYKIKMYSYVYDLFVTIQHINDIGKGYNGAIGKEKYDKIKYYIKAYQKEMGKTLG